MLTKEIIEVLKPRRELKVISESADPRLIDEIHNAGINIYPVNKSVPSVIACIEKMLEMEIYVTERSYNALTEFRNYVWDEDKDGLPLNRPKDGQADHIIDAVRYYVLGMILGKIKKTNKSYRGYFG